MKTSLILFGQGVNPLELTRGANEILICKDGTAATDFGRSEVYSDIFFTSYSIETQTGYGEI